MNNDNYDDIEITFNDKTNFSENNSPVNDINIFQKIGNILWNIFVTIGNILWNIFATIVNFLFAPRGRDLEEQRFLQNMYANMSDQELYREYQNLKIDLLKIKSLKHGREAQNVYMASRSNFFVSAYILHKDLMSNLTLDSLEIEIERPLRFVEKEIKRRNNRLAPQ